MVDLLGINIKAKADGSELVKVETLLRKFIKALQDMAKEQLKLQQTDAANAIGHMSMALQQAAQEALKTGKAVKGTSEDVEKMAKMEEYFAKQSKTALSAWRLFSAGIEKGTATFSDAVKRTEAYDKGLKRLEMDLRLVAKSTREYTKDETEQKKIIESTEKAIKALNSENSIQKIRQLELSGALKVTSAGFKLNNNEAYKLLITNDDLAKKVKLLHGNLTVYQKAVREAADKSKYFNDALKEIQKASKGSEQKFISLVGILKKTETGITSLTLKSKDLTKEEKKAITTIDRFKIVTAELEGNLKRTGTTFQVLNKAGLQAFGNISLQTASKVGILDKSYDKLNVKLQLFKTISGLSTQTLSQFEKRIFSSGKTFEESGLKVDKYIKKFKEFNSVKEKVADLYRSFEILLTTTNKYSAQAKTLVDSFLKTGKGIKDVEHELKKLNTSLKTDAAEQQKLITTLDRLKKKYAELLTSHSKQGIQANRRISSTKLEKKEIESLSVSLAKLNRAYIDGKKHTSAYNKGASVLGRTIQDLIRGIKTYARYMAASSILRGFTDSVRASALEVLNFEQSIHNLTAITQASESGIIQLSNTLLGVSKDTKFGITEVSSAMIKMAQAGFTATEITAGIGSIADLATGSLESLEETVKLVATTLKIFHLEMSDSGAVADIFANAVTKSRLTIQGLNTSMNYIGPIASAAGVGLKDTTAALELLSNSGMRFSTSATGLRRVLNGILNPSDDFAAAVQNAGYTMDDINPKIVGFAEVVRLLPKIVGNAEDAFKMFGIRGAAAVTAFTTQGIDSYNKLRDGLDQVGTAHKMAEEQMKGISVTVTMIVTKFNTLAVVLSKHVLPAVKSFLDIIKKTLDVLVNFAESGIGEVIISMIKWTVIIGTLTFAISKLMSFAFARYIAGIITSLKAYYAVVISSAAATSSFVGPVQHVSMGFQLLATNIKIAVANMWLFIKTPLGATLAIIAAAFSYAFYKSNSYINSMKEAIIKNQEMAGSLDSLNRHLDEYSKYIIKSGKGNEEEIKKKENLIESLDKLKEKYPSLSTEIKKFILNLNEESSSILELSEQVSEFAKRMKNEYDQSLVRAARKAGELYEGVRKLTEQQKQIVGEWELPSIDGEKAVGRTVKAFEKLQKKAKEGNEEAQKTLANIIKGTDVIAENAFAGIENAASLTEKQVKDLALSYDPLRQKTDVFMGSLIQSFKEQSIQSKQIERNAKNNALAAMTVAGISKDVGSYLVKMWADYANESENYVGSMSKHMENFRQKEIEEIDKKISRSQSAAEDEVKIAYDIYSKQFDAMSGNYDAQITLTEAYENKILQIKNTNFQTQIGLLKAKRDLFVKQQAIELVDMSDHNKNLFGLFKHGQDKEMKYLDSSLEYQLKILETNGKSETQILVGKTQAYIDYYKGHVRITEEFSEKAYKITEQEYKDGKELLKATITDEKELTKALHAMDKDRYKNANKSLSDRKKEYESYIKDLKGLEDSLTDAIKAAQEERKGIIKSSEEVLRDIRQADFSNEQKAFEERKRLAKLASDYQKALDEDRIGDAKKIIEELNKGWQEYFQLFSNKEKEIESARKAISKLEEERTKQLRAGKSDDARETNKEIQEQRTALYDLQSEQSQYNSAKLMVQNKLKNNLKEQLDLNSQTTKVLDEQKNAVQNIVTTAEKKVDELGTAMKNNMETYGKMTEYSVIEIGKLNTAIETLANSVIDKPMEDLKDATVETKDAVKILIAEYERAFKAAQKLNNEKSKSNDSEPQMKAKGGIIPGYGGGDVHKHLLESGEAVLPKESVKRFGIPNIRKMIKGITPKFDISSVKPIVQSTQQFFTKNETKENKQHEFTDYGTLNLVVGDKKFPTLVHQDIMGSLQKHIRRSSLMGGNT